MSQNNEKQIEFALNCWKICESTQWFLKL